MIKNVLELLEITTKKYGNKTAVLESESSCSFSKLQEDSMRIGSALIKYDIFGKTVPVFAEKSILTLKAFFGIVYAGGCYSLLSPSHPSERILQIESIIDSPIIITTKEYEDVLRSINVKSLILIADELINTPIDESSLANIRSLSIDTDPLYVNFTSGSTGMPKGVVVGHHSVIEFIHYFTTIFDITSEDIIGNQAPFDFDVSVKDIYSMLMTGASMVIIPKDYFAFPKKLMDILIDNNITVLTWAVSALCMITSLKGFTYKHPTTIKKVLFSGEVMPIKHLREWMSVLPNAMFVNLYGPTEITCNCTYYVITDEQLTEDGIPIGRPFPNERVFLLDETDSEVTTPLTTGEICVSGSTLALGYYGDESTTNASFTQNPLNNRYYQRIYRTGDLAYYRDDGNLIYVGRKDFQIKHLGHRIELGEIESYANSIDGIIRTCCMYDFDNKIIILFYQGSATKSDIRTGLRKSLSKYMIPDKYVCIDSMPLTKNGKIDRKELMKYYSGDK